LRQRQRPVRARKIDVTEVARAEIVPQPSRFDVAMSGIFFGAVVATPPKLSPPSAIDLGKAAAPDSSMSYLPAPFTAAAS
jgi:hypothetical protein